MPSIEAIACWLELLPYCLVVVSVVTLRAAASGAGAKWARIVVAAAAEVLRQCCSAPVLGEYFDCLHSLRLDLGAAKASVGSQCCYYCRHFAAVAVEGIVVNSRESHCCRCCY